MSEKLSRRNFLKASAVTAMGAALAACAQPTPTVAPTKPAAQPTAVPPTAVPPTAVPPTAKPAEPTKPAAPTAVPATAVPPTATAVPKPTYKEAPMLADLVKAGKLPPVEQRLPSDVAVLKPYKEVGQYGGMMRFVSTGPGDIPALVSRMCGGGAQLIFFDTDAATIIPSLALKFEASADGKTYTFYLRKGHKWSDGKPFTTADIEFVWNDLWLNTELTPTFPTWLTVGGQPGKFEKLDDYSFRISFTSPYGLMMLYMAFSSAAFVAQKAYLSQFHPKYAKKEDLDKAIADAKVDKWTLLFSGATSKNDPLRNPAAPQLRTWVVVKPLGNAENIVTMDRNPYYFKVDPSGNQLPYIDSLRITFVENADLIQLKAYAGEIDCQFRNMNFANYTLFKDNEKKGDYKVYNWSTGETGMVAFLNHSLLKDDATRDLIQNIKFRQALSYAINRDEINELKFNGLAGKLQDMFPKALAAEADLWAAHKYDVAKANALLDEIGLKKSGQWRTRADGKEVALNVETYGSFPPILDVGQLMAGYWQKIGINAAVKPVTYEAWWNRIYTSEYQLVVYVNSSYDGLLQSVYARDIVPIVRDAYWAPEWGYWYDTGGKAGTETNNADVKAMQKQFDTLKATADQQKAMDIWTDLFRQYLKGVYAILTVGRYPVVFVVKNGLTNVPETGNHGYLLAAPGYTNPEQYFWKK